MIDSVHETIIAVPAGQRFSCQRCGWCCKGWRIEVTPVERNRLLAHDWGAENPKLRGVKLFEQRSASGQMVPFTHTAQIGGRCVFLSDDNLCIIHSMLGEEAKPAGCRRFPFRLGLLPDAILVGADYACRAMIRNEGALLSTMRQYVPASDLHVGESSSGWDRLAEPRPLLAPGIPLAWSSYLEMEQAILEIVGMMGYPISARVTAAGELISAVAAASSRGDRVKDDEARDWLSTERCDGYSRSFLSAAFSRASVTRPIAALAPLIGDVETSHSSTSGRGSSAIGYAMVAAGGVGKLYISTLDATVDVGSVGEVHCELDAGEFDDYLSRFLANYVMRKSLLESSDLNAGWEYLRTCLSLVQWYARVSAVLSGRTRATRDDVATGIQVVEKSYVS